jgi:quinol monooxygenase YgiN
MKVTIRTGQMFMTALLRAKPEKREELQQLLCSLVDGIQKQPGCLDCLVSQDLEGERRFHLHLVWRDRSSLDAFLHAEVFSILHGALKVLAEPTEFLAVAAEDAFPPGGLDVKARPATPSTAPQPSSPP